MKSDIITTMNVNNANVRVMRINNEDYISLTDIARIKNNDTPADVIKKWMSNYDTIEYIGLWEELNNKDFNLAEFRQIKKESSNKSFTMSPSKWVKSVNSIGIKNSQGKYSIGVFAHSDIALQFASWIDNLFKLYLIKEFQRLKKNELYQEKVEWQANRILSKLNYLVHTNAVKEYIVPELTNEQKRFVYAEEADVLNVALFGMTAKEWRDANPELSESGNIRDYTDLIHLIILNNLENTNAELIKLNIKQSDRLVRLNESARNQMNILKNNKELIKFDNKYKLKDK